MRVSCSAEENAFQLCSGGVFHVASATHEPFLQLGPTRVGFASPQPQPQNIFPKGRVEFHSHQQKQSRSSQNHLFSKIRLKCSCKYPKQSQTKLSSVTDSFAETVCRAVLLNVRMRIQEWREIQRENLRSLLAFLLTLDKINALIQLLESLCSSSPNPLLSLFKNFYC